jgi:hypothetical protein
MTPTQRPSSIAGLRRGIATTTAAEPANPTHVSHISADRGSPIKPARVTLNLHPDLYRTLTAWCTTAARDIGAPRVSVQDALRTMITTAITDKDITAEVIEQLRQTRDS